MTRLTLRRVLTSVSFLAVILGGAAAPAVASVDTGSMSPYCWMDRCQL